MGNLTDLDRRLSRKIEQHKTIQLSPEDLDMLVETGAYSAFRRAVDEYQRKQCQHRSARSRSINGGLTASTDGKAEKTSKSSGTMKSESASEALAQAQQMLGMAS